MWQWDIPIKCFYNQEDSLFLYWTSTTWWLSCTTMVSLWAIGMTALWQVVVNLWNPPVAIDGHVRSFVSTDHEYFIMLVYSSLHTHMGAKTASRYGGSCNSLYGQAIVFRDLLHSYRIQNTHASWSYLQVHRSIISTPRSRLTDHHYPRTMRYCPRFTIHNHQFGRNKDDDKTRHKVLGGCRVTESDKRCNTDGLSITTW